ncbi:MAG TPA: hypothetical protein VGB15_17615, partial [Longimicrobium sp.]
MRIDLIKLPALALAAAALAAPPGARAQAAPEAPPAPPAVAAPAAPQAPPAAPRVTRGSTLALKGLTVARGQVVDGDVVAPFGDVRVEGEVTGNV